MYEARYEACSDHGWSLDGHAGGEDSYVAFKTTPCGTRVAVKGSRRNATIQHIQRECEVLRSLSGDAEVAKSCAHCFPKYYYYSKTSRACYSEVIPNAGSTLIRAMKSRKPGALSVTKHVLLQGLTALRLLLKHNVEVSRRHWPSPSGAVTSVPTESPSLLHYVVLFPVAFFYYCTGAVWPQSILV